MNLDNAMAQVFKNLERDVKSFEKNLRKAASDTAKAKTIETLRILAAISPIDTSRLVSNWRVSVGFPKTTKISPYVPGLDGDTGPASVYAMIANAQDSMRNKKTGQTIFITNNVPYLDKLRYEAEPHWRKPNFGRDVDTALGMDTVKFIWPQALM